MGSNMLQGQTLWELLEERVALTPDALMAVDENSRRISFAEYRNASERAAAGLAAEGVKPGDVVSWQLPTWIESLVLVGALSRLGAIQNPLLPIYREKEVGFTVNQADATLLIVPSVWKDFDFGAMANAIAEKKGNTKVLIADKTLPEGDPSTLPPLPAQGGTPEGRWLFYTSGTTADPKGAQHTDASIAAVAKGMGERMRVVQEDRNALIFPFTHIGGITWLFTSLQSGCSNILMESFHPQETPQVLGREDVTLAGSGTVFHQTYLAYQKTQDAPIFPSVRGFPGGGAPKPPALVAEMREVFNAPILSGYGLTEAPILTMADFDDSDTELAESEGKPMPGVELKLVTLEGEVAAQGEEGEVRAKAPQVMLGYLDSSLDADAFDSEGYFRTGDLGRIDDRGNLVITGRVKDVIIRKGENVSAKEVEDMLYTSPLVGDVAVIGLPDERSGERVCAVIRPAADADVITFEQMVAHLKDGGLMTQKLPEQMEIVDTIPRNPAGKVLKHVLREQYSD